MYTMRVGTDKLRQGRAVWRSSIQPVVIGGWVLRDTIVIFLLYLNRMLKSITTRPDPRHLAVVLFVLFHLKCEKTFMLDGCKHYMHKLFSKQGYL